MKLQEASRKELTRIAWGVLICDGIMIAALFVLSLLGIGSFSALRILLGAAGGSMIAIGNFALLCLTVQNAANTEDQKLIPAQLQSAVGDTGSLDRRRLPDSLDPFPCRRPAHHFPQSGHLFPAGHRTTDACLPGPTAC